MQLALFLLGLLLAVMLALVLLALALPVDVRVRLSKIRDIQFAVQGRFFGGIGPWVNLSGAGRRRTVKEPKPRPRKKMKRRRSFHAIILAAKRLMTDVLSRFHIEELSIEGEFGTGDPAETGMIFGSLAPLIYGTDSLVLLRPNFNQACLSGQCTAVIRFRPFTLVAPATRFFWALYRSRQ